MINALSRQTVPLDTGDFRLLSRRTVDAVTMLRERHRFMKGLFAWVGYRQVFVPYERDKRFAGATKWNYWRLWNFSLEGIRSFSIGPLKVATYIGIFTAAAAVFMEVISSVAQFCSETQFPDIHRFSSLSCSLAVFS